MRTAKNFTEAMRDEQFYRPLLMGPNCVMLADEATRDLDLPGCVRALDLGCGTGLTSMFLAERFDAAVFATD
ncbi:hypothetical protein LJC31_02145, partial [Synergistaceae bacterium OttesenSCG-928-I11]|nr:hypothetical protein [Synergistaceae bacterium OttesenSCG-928-I11]